MADRYANWRAQCAALRKAYEAWSRGPASERSLAFEAYGAALDLEQQASLLYEQSVGRVAREAA
jgi:hypothetical protein